MKQYQKIVLAYSGGLDTSVIIPWLKENYGCEVVAAAGRLSRLALRPNDHRAVSGRGGVLHGVAHRGGDRLRFHHHPGAEYQ